MRIASFVLITMALLVSTPLRAETLSDVVTAHKIPVNLFSLVDDRYQNHRPREQHHYHPLLLLHLLLQTPRQLFDLFRLFDHVHR